MTEVLDRVDQVAGVLTRQVEDYAQRSDLTDDAGWDPATRLATAGDELDRLREGLTAARKAVRAFHSEIGHVGTRVPANDDVVGGA